MIKNTAIARQQLDKRFAKMQPLDIFARPPRGWIRAIRDSLGMTASQLAARLGVSKPRVVVIEQGEVEGSLTLHSLQRAAEALNCTLIYALVPNRPLDETVRTQAAAIASERLAAVEYSMQLENQAVSPSDAKRHREQLIEQILRDEIRRLWDRL
jgi:predicted DNA-binding mobile mystery protein A